MSHKISDKTLKSHLEKISKPDLVAWLMKRCADDEKLRASLLDLATPREAAKALTAEVRARIRQAWLLSKRRDGWKMVRPIAGELNQVLASIQTLIDKGCSVEAEKLLAVFVQAAEKGLAHIDDSHGYLWPTCQYGVTLWGQAWARIESRDRKRLADLVYGHIHENGYAVKDNIISKFAEALGEEGLHILQWRLKGDLAALPQPSPPARVSDIKRVLVTGWLKEIADALGDVDDYIAIVESERRVETCALPVARRLFEAGRFMEALVFLERGRADRGPRYDEPYDYATLKTKILTALGRSGEARETLWQEFATYLSMSTWQNIWELTGQEQKEQARSRAVSTAEHHRSPERAALLLVRLNELQRAADLIERRQSEFCGAAYDVLLKVADALAQTHPAQTWILYKVLLLNILDESRYNAYPHAAEYLMRMQELADASGLQTQQSEFTASLQQTHGRKSSFWARVKNRG